MTTSPHISSLLWLTTTPVSLESLLLSLTSLSQTSTVCGLYKRRLHLKFTNASNFSLGKNPSRHQMTLTRSQHLSFHGILAMRLHEKHCSGHLSLPTLSKSSLSRTVRLLSGNVLKTNTANRSTLNTYESIRNFKPYVKTRRPP